jgi:hypothetical protein
LDVKLVIDSVTAAVATLTFVVGAISAKRPWDEKRRNLKLSQMKKRQGEVHRLMDAFAAHAATFANVFDYESGTDRDLRIDNLTFQPEETATRTRVDGAFEHLRDLYRSLSLGLIEAKDLSFWTYWIHRVPQRVALADYARACGYDSFLRPLREATTLDPQLRELQEHCPWWPKEAAAGARGQGGERAGVSAPESSDVREAVTSGRGTDETRKQA